MTECVTECVTKCVTVYAYLCQPGRHPLPARVHTQLGQGEGHGGQRLRVGCGVGQAGEAGPQQACGARPQAALQAGVLRGGQGGCAEGRHVLRGGGGGGRKREGDFFFWGGGGAGV